VDGGDCVFRHLVFKHLLVQKKSVAAASAAHLGEEIDQIAQMLLVQMTELAAMDPANLSVEPLQDTPTSRS